MGILCNWSDKEESKGEYIQEGQIVILKFITEELM